MTFISSSFFTGTLGSTLHTSLSAEVKQEYCTETQKDCELEFTKAWWCCSNQLTMGQANKTNTRVTAEDIFLIAVYSNTTHINVFATNQVRCNQNPTRPARSHLCCRTSPALDSMLGQENIPVSPQFPEGRNPGAAAPTPPGLADPGMRVTRQNLPSPGSGNSRGNLV